MRSIEKYKERHADRQTEARQRGEMERDRETE